VQILLLLLLLHLLLELHLLLILKLLLQLHMGSTIGGRKQSRGARRRVLHMHVLRQVSRVARRRTLDELLLEQFALGERAGVLRVVCSRRL
jgi:hypothetical protein